MAQRLYFQLPGAWTKQEFISNLRRNFAIKFMPLQHELIRYYDTFDRRLNENHMSLSWNGERLILITYIPGYTEIECRYDREPKFAQNLPPFTLQSKLSGLIEFRALLPLFTIKRLALPLKFLDQENKTVCLGYYEKNGITRERVHKRFKPLYSIVPLKGYLPWAERIGAWLQNQGGSLIESDLYFLALEKVHAGPDQHYLRMNRRLSVERNLLPAAQIVLQQQLTILTGNEDGIMKDIDTEFLHDFRVAVRRIRSLIGNLKTYLKPSIHNRAEKDFTFLIKLTNKRRDLDIFLQKQSIYLQFLPARNRAAILPFFSYLRLRRDKEQKTIERFLDSTEFKRIKTFWTNLAQGSTASVNIWGNRTLKIRTVIPSVVLKRYKKTVGFNQNLPAILPDTYLHRVRIACKKLRYTLEFFQYSDILIKAKKIIKKLRNLQVTLGEYNDLRLQQQWINIYIRNQRRRKNTELAAVTAAQFLWNRLQQEKNELQLLFRKQFADFCQTSWQQEMMAAFQCVRKR